MSSKHIQENQGNSWENKVNRNYKTLFDSTSLRLSIISGVLFLSAIVFIFGGCSRESSKEDLGLINRRFEQLENKITQLEAQFTETNDSVTTLGSYVIALEERVEKLTKEIEEAPFSKQTVSQAKEQYYTVVRGDTLYSISRQYGLSVEKIRQLNNLREKQLIQPGQKLRVTTDSNK
jgi:LysM repeat protein